MNRDRHTQLALWAVFAATAAVRIGFGAIMPVLPLYAQQHGMGTVMIAVMTNAYMLANALFQGYAGHLGDRWGRRPVMLAGTWLYTAAAALFMVDGGPWFYVALRGLEGLGACAFGPTVRAYVADLVPETGRGKVYGQLMSFEMAGILFGPMIGGLAEGLAGPRAPFAVCAILGLVAAIPLLLFTHPGHVQAELAAAASGEIAPPRTVSTRSIVASPAFWAVALPGLGFAYLNGLYNVIWSLYMQKVGASTWQISLSFTLFALPMVLLMVPFGTLGDRVGRPLLIGIGGALGSVVTLLYGFFPYPNALVTLSGIDGVAGSLFTPASQAFMADVAPKHIRGKFIGTVGSLNTAATIVASTAVGFLYEQTHPKVLFGIGALALAFACGSAVVLMTRRPVADLRRALEEL